MLGCGRLGGLAVLGFCTLNNRVRTPSHGTSHTGQQQGSLQRACGAPYQPFVWPKSSSYYGPPYAPSTGPLRPELVEHKTTSLANRGGAPWVSSAPWPRPYAPRYTLVSSPSLSLVPATAFGLGRPQASAGPTIASQARSTSTIARPRGGGSRPSWEYGENGGDRPCWREESYNAGPSTYHSSRRRNSSAACTSYCAAPDGWESLCIAGRGSQRQSWSRLVHPSPLCASGTDGPRNDKHGSTPFRDQTGNLIS